MSNQNPKILKAKTTLILDQPFFASLLLPMPLIEDAGIPTMATNGESIRYNPAFLDSMSQKETVFVLAHEVMHAVFGHMFRRDERDPDLWNIASDYVVNDILVKENVGTMPKGGLLDAGLVSKGNGTAEGVYNCLPKPKPKPKSETGEKPGDKSGEDSAPSEGTGRPDPKAKGKPGSSGVPKPGEAGGALDHIESASEDPSVQSQKEAENRIKIIQARNAAKMMGKLSAGLDRLVEDATKVETDWKHVLRRFLSERAKTDLSYAKPKRRFLAEDIYLPSLVGEKLGAIAVAVDCSGSIDDRVLGVFETEIKAIVQDTCPAETRIVYFDAKVLRREAYGPDDTVKLKPAGGGGTRFSPIFRALDTDETPPVACVVLTDLCCSDYGPVPNYPVLWACTEKSAPEVPFGEVIHIKAGD